MPQRISDQTASVARWRAAQQGLSRLLTQDMQRLRRLILPSQLRSSVPDWIASVNAVVDQYSRASASLAADFYEAERAAAQVRQSFSTPLADPPAAEQVSETMRWATADLWPRDPEDPATTPAQKKPLTVRLEAAGAKAERAAQKLAADTGRRTVAGAAQQDRLAVGWARSAALGACAFCKMLATRGMVYKRDTVDFRAHDGCHCGVIPVFKGQRFELSDKAKEWERLYREYAAPHSGSQLQRFRAALAEHGHLPATH
ncbi:VG15 protein [Streptomyces misionensis]